MYLKIAEKANKGSIKKSYLPFLSPFLLILFFAPYFNFPSFSSHFHSFPSIHILEYPIFILFFSALNFFASLFIYLSLLSFHVKSSFIHTFLSFIFLFPSMTFSFYPSFPSLTTTIFLPSLSVPLSSHLLDIYYHPYLPYHLFYRFLYSSSFYL